MYDGIINFTSDSIAGMYSRGEHLKITLPYFNEKVFLDRYPEVRKKLTLHKQNTREIQDKIKRKILSMKDDTNIDLEDEDYINLTTTVLPWELYVYKTIREYTSSYKYKMIADVLNILEIPSYDGEPLWSNATIKSLIFKVENRDLLDSVQKYNIYNTPEYEEFIINVIGPYLIHKNDESRRSYSPIFIIHALKEFKYPYLSKNRFEWPTFAIRDLRIKARRKQNKEN